MNPDELQSELATISGLNDLLTGMAPAQVMASSKAINALVANYEAGLLSDQQALASLALIDVVPGTEADRAAAKEILGYDPMPMRRHLEVTDPNLRADSLQIKLQLMTAMQQLGGPRFPRVVADS